MRLRRISEAMLRRQFDQVVADGRWIYLEEAAEVAFPNREIDAATLFAIGSRETNWDKRYLREPGDNGNGFGPMQIDKRSFAAWVESGAWQDPWKGILKGAQVLAEKLAGVRAKMGKPLTVKDRAGKAYTVNAVRLDDEELVRVAIAAYNCGRWSLYHVSKGRDPDHGTTDKDYSADVLARAERARKWSAPKIELVTCPRCGGAGLVPA